MSLHPGFVIEAMVAMLLAVSIGYSVALERRLRALRLGEAELRKTIAELDGAAERSERAIAALRIALEDSDAMLAEQLRLADRRGAELKAQEAAGGDILARISRIVGVGEPRVAA